MLSQVEELIKLMWAPSSAADVIKLAIVLWVVLGVWLVIRALRGKRGTTLAKVLLIFLWFFVPICYIVTSLWMVPHFQRFTEGKVGIAIAHFSGARLHEHFGTDGIEERMRHQLDLKLREKLINDLVEVRTLSWQPSNRIEAEALRVKFRATGLIWGNVSKRGDHADLLINPSWECDTSGISISYSDGSRAEILWSFEPDRGGPCSLSLGRSDHDESDLVEPIVLDMIPSVCEKLLSLDTARYLSFMEGLFMFHDRAKYQEWTPILLTQAAQIALWRYDTTQAIEWFRLSSEYSCTLLVSDNVNISWADEPFPYGRIAAFSKFYEGTLLLATGDTASAILPLMWCAMLDSAFESTGINLVQSILGERFEQTLFERPPDCFPLQDRVWFETMKVPAAELRKPHF